MRATPPSGERPAGEDPHPREPARVELSRAERERVEETLATLHREVTERLDTLTGHFRDLVAASAHSNADDEHDPEGATIAFERSQLDSLVTRSRAQLGDVEAARERLATGRYGTCERCGRPVGDARLDALPTTRTCIECAARSRQGRGGR